MPDSEVERVAMAITKTLIRSMSRDSEAWMVILTDLEQVATGARHWGSKEKADKRIRAMARAAIKAMNV